MGLDSFIREYSAKGLIAKQRAGFDQINNLIGQSRNELSACKKILEISPQVAFTCAYTSMLYAARALMLFEGYRPAGNNQHKTVVAFVEAAIGSGYKALAQKFDNMRKRRNLVIYEPWEVNISKTDTQNAIKSAGELISIIIECIKKHDPQHKFEF